VLSTGGDDRDRDEEKIQLLADIAEAFDGHETIHTATLLERLNAVEESPWGGKRRGEGLDGRGLAHLLRPFNIHPRQVRVGEVTKKGYQLEWFEDAFARYLPDGKQGKQGKQPSAQEALGKANVSHVSHVSPPEQDALGDDPGQAEADRLRAKGWDL
jgi:hypothetical protein